MENLVSSWYRPFNLFYDINTETYRRFLHVNDKITMALVETIPYLPTYWKGISKYLNDFLEPYYIAQDSFLAVEKEKMAKTPFGESLRDHLELFRFNLDVAEKGVKSSFDVMNTFHLNKATKAWAAWLNTILDGEGEDIAAFAARERKLLETVVYEYPQTIRDIKPEYGLDLGDEGYIKTAETDRFQLYQVLPTRLVEVREDGKPVIIIPPYVLGPNIMAFLPDEGKSYVHCFANQGIPTYIRILKNIDTHPAVQTMTGEDDAQDTRFFCEMLTEKHQRAVTLNGFCQGGFIAMANLLSGELDGLVDGLITCVAPMDGTRSKSLVAYLHHLPQRFRDLLYAVKQLPNGNQVVDGKVMSWVFKLKSMESEAPIFTFYRDLMMFDRPDVPQVKIGKTAAAINHWLIYDRTDLPVAITQMSFDSYTIPVDKEGTLPVQLFGRKLNFKRLKEKGVHYLITYADKDDLVDQEAALAATDYIPAEITIYPKGHGGIATSWSLPTSECAHHTCFLGASGRRKSRGVVRYHLDLEQGLIKDGERRSGAERRKDVARSYKRY